MAIRHCCDLANLYAGAAPRIFEWGGGGRIVGSVATGVYGGGSGVYVPTGFQKQWVRVPTRLPPPPPPPVATPLFVCIKIREVA